MNTAIIPQGQGLSFAISAATIQKVVPELIKNGRVIRPWAGFVCADFTPQLARRLGMEYSPGAIIQVYSGFPAEKAGLATGDVIVEAAGQPIKTALDLMSVVDSHKVGDKLPLLVIHEGAKYKLTVTLAEKPNR
jgi:serine protease Do